MMRGVESTAWATVVAVLLGSSAIVSPQPREPKSAALVKELAKRLEEAKLDSFAAKDPAATDQFIGALYFAGSMLLVVEAKYPVPQLLEERIAKKEFRDVYVDLHSASVPASKVFIQDLQADGLKIRQGGTEPFDTYEASGKQLSFDEDWRRQQRISEQDFAKAFAAADEEYSRMLTVLLEALKKFS